MPTVEAIEQFLALRGKGLVCDGCGKSFEPVVESDSDGRKNRRAAAIAGWQIGAGTVGPDFCPACQH